MSDNKAMATQKQRAAGLAPVFSGQEMSVALTAYKELQKVLDEKMPDQIMTIGKGKNAKKFRKKGYWRATQVAFGLDIELVKEELIRLAEGDWGYIVVYRSVSPNGRSMVGDGSCMASEKKVFVKDWKAWRKNGSKGPPPLVLDGDGSPKIDKLGTAENATVHNVRAHAHTRAKNRAISDHVGFGEVSAEEINYNQRDQESGSQRQNSHARNGQAREEDKFAQLYGRAKQGGMDDATWKKIHQVVGIVKEGHRKDAVLLAALESELNDWERATIDNAQRDPDQPSTDQPEPQHSEGPTPLDDPPDDDPGPAEFESPALPPAQDHSYEELKHWATQDGMTALEFAGLCTKCQVTPRTRSKKGLRELGGLIDAWVQGERE